MLREGGYEEDKLFRGIHPVMADRLHLWRLKNFKIERLPSVEDVYLLHAVAIENPKDERLFACAEVRDLTPVRDEEGRIVAAAAPGTDVRRGAGGYPAVSDAASSAGAPVLEPGLSLRLAASDVKPDEMNDIVHQAGAGDRGLGLEQVVVRGTHAQSARPASCATCCCASRIPAAPGLLMTLRPATKLQPLKPLAEYDQKVVKMRQRGLIYPYEIVKMLTPSPQDTRAEFPAGDFLEYDLDAEEQPGRRWIGLTARTKPTSSSGVIRNFTPKYPEGMTRVLLLGDPSKDMGALAEPECRRIIAALDLAREKGVPLEWFRSPPAPRSPWTAAWRTWTGSPAFCAA